MREALQQLNLPMPTLEKIEVCVWIVGHEVPIKSKLCFINLE